MGSLNSLNGEVPRARWRGQGADARAWVERLPGTVPLAEASDLELTLAGESPEVSAEWRKRHPAGERVSAWAAETHRAAWRGRWRGVISCPWEEHDVRVLLRRAARAWSGVTGIELALEFDPYWTPARAGAPWVLAREEGPEAGPIDLGAIEETVRAMAEAIACHYL